MKRVSERTLLRGRVVCIGGKVALALLTFCPEGHAADGPRLQLVGTVQAPHGGLIICRDPSTGKTFSLKNGSSFDGWTLTAIGRDDATFERASVSARLYVSSPSNQTFMPAVPAAPRPDATTPPPPSPPASGAPTSVPPGKFLDGDGNIIDPPQQSRPSSPLQPWPSSPPQPWPSSRPQPWDGL